jgi:hypothetical protein
MVAYYEFPREHWPHLRTTNVIESPSAAVRLRASAAKRFKKGEHATVLIWKTLLVVEQDFRKLNAPHLCQAVCDGVLFRDGVRITRSPRDQRAAGRHLHTHRQEFGRGVQSRATLPRPGLNFLSRCHYDR